MGLKPKATAPGCAQGAFIAQSIRFTIAWRHILIYLDVFGLRAFAWYIVLGGILGLAAGIALIRFLGKRGFFKRANRLHNFLVKGNYLYIPAIFTVAFMFISLILGLHLATRELFEPHREGLARVSSEAVRRAFLDIHEATKGQDVLNEFIPSVSEVLASYVDEAAFATLGGDYALMGIVEPLRYGLRMSLKSSFESELRSEYPRNATIPAAEFYGAFQSRVSASFKGGYYPGFFWESIASRIWPLYLSVLLKALLFAFPICLELALFLLLWRPAMAGVAGGAGKDALAGGEGEDALAGGEGDPKGPRPKPVPFSLRRPYRRRVGELDPQPENRRAQG
jgi:hypothetical protein